MGYRPRRWERRRWHRRIEILADNLIKSMLVVASKRVYNRYYCIVRFGVFLFLIMWTTCNEEGGSIASLLLCVVGNCVVACSPNIYQITNTNYDATKIS